jgi:hypothetical protein
LEGDKEAVAAAREMLPKSPELVRALGGDVADYAVDRLISASWQQSIVGAAVRAEVERLRVGLAGEKPSPLEELLAHRIAACWLQMAHTDLLYAGNLKDASARTIELLEDRRDRAHRRYLSAIKALAQVRRLLVPMVQVNVAGQQVVANAVGK